MTGFGEASATHEGVHYFLEVRSLNNKYFKATIRLPENLQGLEPVLESELRQRLNRGTVTAIGKCSDQSAQAAWTINTAALTRYVDSLLQAPAVESGKVTLDTASLLSLPGVLTPPDEGEGRLSRARDVFVQLVEVASQHLLSMRKREGATLAEELRTHVRVIDEALSRVRERSPLVVSVFEERLRSRVEGMLEDAGVMSEPADLIREVAIYAEKADIAEEVARLGAHIEQFRELMGEENNGEPVGRTLEFLSQEMLREANTIASKSSDAQISREIVLIKGAIDRIKEQVLNIE